MSDEVVLEPTTEVTLPPDEIVWDVENPELNLDLVIWPEPFLRHAVSPFQEEQIKTDMVRNVVGAMIRAMYKFNGVGLAAEQVGVPQSVFVMDHQYQNTGEKKPRVFFNSCIVSEEGPVVEVERPGEGCLSTPYSFFRPVKRAGRIELEWLDHKGEFHAEWFEGIEAVVIQHEVDHLYGKLFVDRLSRLQQDMFKRRARKVRRIIRKQFEGRLLELKHAPRQSPQYNLERYRNFKRKPDVAETDTK